MTAKRKRTLAWAVVLFLVALACLGGTTIKNNLLNRQSLDELLALPHLQAELLDSLSYITPAQGKCFHFVGAAFCTTSSPEAFVQAFAPSPQGEIQNNLVFVWPVGDSFAIQPLGLGRLMSPSPLSLSFIGGDAQTGVEQLLRSGSCTTHRMVVFSYLQRFNLLDYRCY